ncbi:MAG TPA: copper resistance protein CopC, partial [Actinomycetes bacterium]
MRRTLVAALLAGVALLLAAPAVSAHAVLRSSDPASGASLSKPPQKVTLTFTEPPDLTLSSVHVLDSTGKAVESGKARAVPGNQLALEVPLGQLGSGTYTVSWRTVSRADGHLTNGSYAFGVGVQAAGAQTGGTAATAASPPPSVLGVAGRWALDWGLILVVGAVASSLLVFRQRASGPPLPLLGGALALAAAGLLAMIFAERSRVGVSLGALLGTSTGAKLVNQAVVLAITALVLGAVWRWPRRAELLGLLGVGAAATMLVHVAGGHASGERSLTGLNILVQWAHLLAVGVWVGGFLWLLLGLRSRNAPGSGPEPGSGNGLVASMRLEHVHARSGQPRTPAAGATPAPAGAGATAGNGG